MMVVQSDAYIIRLCASVRKPKITWLERVSKDDLHENEIFDHRGLRRKIFVDDYKQYDNNYFWFM